MPFYPDEVRTDPLLPHPSRPARAERGAERAHQSQRRWRRFSIVAALFLSLIGAGIAKAWAWTADISGKGVCNTQTGQYDLAWTLDNTSEPEPASVTGDLSATVPAYGTETVTESVPGSTSGSVSRTVTINWPSDQANLERTGTVELAGDCEKPTPPTSTTNPPPDEEKDDFAGTATDQSRTPPDQHGTPTEEETAPPVTAPPAGQLPFTGPALIHVELVLMAVLFLGGALMVLGGRRRYQQLSLVEKAFDRAMRKPYNGPRERL